jgi:hypothetical protein
MLFDFEQSVRVAIILVLFIVLCSFSAVMGESRDFGGNLRVTGQDSLHVLTMNNGSKLFGKITSVTDSTIVFQSEIGESNIPITNLKDIKIVSSKAMKGGNYWFENPNLTRLYFSPTARMLKAGQGYFCDYYLFFPGIAYGMSDNITIGAGMSLFPGVDLSKQLYYFSPKIGLSATRNSSFSIGALIFALPEIEDEHHSLGVVIGSGTFGNPDASLSLGLGYGFVDDKFADKPMITLGGEIRFARRASFVSENWILPGTDRVPAFYGMRFFGEGISVDLALISLIGGGGVFPGIPWVDFVFNFN